MARLNILKCSNIAIKLVVANHKSSKMNEKSKHHHWRFISKFERKKKDHIAHKLESKHNIVIHKCKVVGLGKNGTIFCLKRVCVNEAIEHVFHNKPFEVVFHHFCASPTIHCPMSMCTPHALLAQIHPLSLSYSIISHVRKVHNIRSKNYYATFDYNNFTSLRVNDNNSDLLKREFKQLWCTLTIWEMVCV